MGGGYGGGRRKFASTSAGWRKKAWASGECWAQAVAELTSVCLFHNSLKCFLFLCEYIVPRSTINDLHVRVCDYFPPSSGCISHFGAHVDVCMNTWTWNQITWIWTSAQSRVVEKLLNRRCSVKWTWALCVKLQMFRQKKEKKKSYFSLNLYWWPGRNQRALQFCKGEDV